MNRSLFHILLPNAERGCAAWDQYLLVVGCPTVLSSALYALDDPSYMRGVVSLTIVIAFAVTVPNTNSALQKLRAGTPMQRAYASIMTQHAFGWHGRPKLVLFLAVFVLWVIGFAACMMQPVVARLS